MRLYLTLNMLIAVGDSRALTLFHLQNHTILYITNIEGMAADTVPVIKAWRRMARPQATPKQTAN